MLFIVIGCVVCEESVSVGKYPATGCVTVGMILLLVSSYTVLALSLLPTIAVISDATLFHYPFLFITEKGRAYERVLRMIITTSAEQ